MPEKRRQQAIDVKAQILSMLQNQDPEVRDQTRVWLINDSKLWYADDKQAEAYLAVDKSDEYRKGMHDAERSLIDQNIWAITSHMDSNLSFFDLGCGNALMTINIVKQAELRDIYAAFYPVDISATMLAVAVENAKRAGITEVVGIWGDFEKLGQLLEGTRTDEQRFFNLGANFVNFNSDHILSLINSVMRQNDVIYFSAQISDGNQEAIVKEYDNQVIADWIFIIFENIGLQPDKVEYHARLNPQAREIECYVVVKELPDELKGTGIREGDEIVVITSFKPALEQFKELAYRYFDGEFLFNEDRTYVAFIGKKKL